ncbi:fasciclin domain-containing protein [Methanoculleus chikugoensis]|uniref:fasciclin domain-containing protein n=1 Tax=Methanoculleus chikugoensis TaxID=118126 RepID=UPI001C7FE385|nr:fasciclin domain-containing protein [Methanoculleus chikugoensis]
MNSTESYAVPQATVLGALDEASILGDFKYLVAKDLPPEEGNLSILAIAGIENKIVNGTPNNWTFWVNDEAGTTGPAVTNVTDGDNLTFSYGPPDHTLENATYTLTIDVTVLGAVVTPTPTGNVTPTPTGNVTPTPTGNVTPTPTGNVTPTPTGNVTPTPTGNVTPTPTGNVTPPTEANVTIIEPMEGANVTAGNVTVSVNVTNFTLVEPTGQPNAPGEGHLHYYLDAPVPTNASEPAIPPTGGYVISTNLTHTWENVTAGAHNLSVQLVNNDHTPLIPLVADTVNVTATGGVNVTPTPTVNVTPTPTMNVTPTPTVNVTPTPTVNVTPTPTVNVTPTPTVNVTPTPTVNVTPTPTVNVTPTPTVNVTPTPTPAVNVTAQIATKLSGEENLTTFVTVINNSTIDQRLQQNVTYVICAPTNEAFAGLGNQTLSAILNDTTLLNNIIDYHTIQGNYTIEDLVKLCRNSTDGQISLPTVEGTNVNVSITDDGRLIINNNVVVRQIQITNNITVYVIDGVLIPPGTTIPTPTPTVNVTPTPTVNVTPTPTVNVTPTPTVNVTPTPTVNVTPTPTVNVTPTPTVNVTPTPTVNVTPTPTVNVTPTPTVNVTPTPTVNVTPTPTVNVTPTPTVNVTPTPGKTVDLELYEGWNFVSIPKPLSAGNNTVAAVFGDVDMGGRSVYTFAPATGFTPVGENETLKVLEGYWVYSAENLTLKLNLSTNPMRAPATKTLSPGWNAIGYSDLTPHSADETLRSVENVWVYVVGYNADDQTYRPVIVNNQTDDQGLSPTEGYWLFVREDGRLAAISA